MSTKTAKLGPEPSAGLQVQERDPDRDSIIGSLRVYGARAKELPELAEGTKLEIVSDLAKKVAALQSEAAKLPLVISHLLGYLDWRKKSIGGRGAELTENRALFKGEYVHPSKPHPTPAATDDYEAFLQEREYLLANHRDMFVAFVGGRLVAADRSLDAVFSRLRELPGCSAAFIELVDEAAFEQPCAVEIPGAYEVIPTGDTTP